MPDVTPSIGQVLQDIHSRAKTLHEYVDTILTYTSPEDVMEEIIRRGEFKNTIDKAINKLEDHIQDLKSKKRELRTLRSEISSDNEKLETQKWNLINERKSLNI